jgi:hypothetical protein
MHILTVECRNLQHSCDARCAVGQIPPESSGTRKVTTRTKSRLIRRSGDGLERGLRCEDCTLVPRGRRGACFNAYAPWGRPSFFVVCLTPGARPCLLVVFGRPLPHGIASAVTGRRQFVRPTRSSGRAAARKNDGLPQRARRLAQPKFHRIGSSKPRAIQYNGMFQTKDTVRNS